MKTSILRSMNQAELGRLEADLRDELRNERNTQRQVELQTHIAWVQKVRDEQRDERSSRKV